MKAGGNSVPDLGEKKMWKGPKVNESKEASGKKNEIQKFIKNQFAQGPV